MNAQKGVLRIWRKRKNASIPRTPTSSRGSIWIPFSWRCARSTRICPDTSLQLYGHSFRTPIMMAALSHLNNCWPDGMVEMARGAAAAGAVMWSGMGDDDELSRICDTGAKTIKIIKPYQDEDLLLHKIRHAERCGCIAVGIDIDHAFGHKGGYDNVLGYPMTPKSAQRLADFVRSTSLPFVIKGVLSVQDALECAEIGVKGIVVSHHHGIHALCGAAADGASQDRPGRGQAHAHLRGLRPVQRHGRLQMPGLRRHRRVRRPQGSWSICKRTAPRAWNRAWRN